MPVANERFPERAFPTPLLNDVVFYEFRDELYPKNKERDYGQPHPDKQKWPHHELCYVSSADASGKFQWWYAAKRENQDLYNYEFTDADIGGTKFPAVKRGYVYRRSEFDPAAIAMGAAMPNVPKNLFGAGSGGTPDVIPGYILAERREARIGEKELDSLFVAEERVYVARTTFIGSRTDPSSGLSYAVTTKLYYTGEAIGETGGVHSDGSETSITPLTSNWTMVETKQLLSLAPEYQKKSSRLMPEQYFADGQTSTEKDIISDASGEPSVPSGADKTQIVVSQKGKIQETTTTVQNGNPTTIIGTSFDERTGQTFIETREVVAKSAVVESAVQADGTLVSFQAYDANWSIKITRTEVSSLSRAWTDIINFEWPPVLTDLTFKVWASKVGRDVTYVVPRYKRGFYGPQAASVVQYWQQDAPTIVSPTHMIPQGFNYNCPLYNVSVPPCLHSKITLFCNIGTVDPDWEQQSDSEAFEATNLTDWPDSITWTESKPYRGGYIVTETTINKPD